MLPREIDEEYNNELKVYKFPTELKVKVLKNKTKELSKNPYNRMTIIMFRVTIIIIKVTIIISKVKFRYNKVRVYLFPILN